jgi:hypothetical protein
MADSHFHTAAAFKSDRAVNRVADEVMARTICIVNSRLVYWADFAVQYRRRYSASSHASQTAVLSAAVAGVLLIHSPLLMFSGGPLHFALLSFGQPENDVSKSLKIIVVIV